MNKLRIAGLLSALCITVFIFSCSKGYHGKVYSNNNISLTSSKVATVNGIVLPPSPGSGSAQVNYDNVTHTLNYTLSWNNLSSPPIAIHVHGLSDTGKIALPFPLGPYGVDSFKVSPTTYVKYVGGIAQKITVPGGSSNTGSITGALSADNVVIKESDLLAGKYYFDIHTATNQFYIAFGEVRGQITFNQ